MHENTAERYETKHHSAHYVKTGIAIVFIFEIVNLFMYGFFTSYTVVSYTTKLEYILTNTLAVLGFGLLLIHYRFSIKQTIIVALVVCAVNVQIGPLMQQFWYNVFIAGFNKGFIPSSNTTFYLTLDTATVDVKNITLGFVRISTFASISLLVALSGVIGRIGAVNTLITSILFNVGFNLNYYLNYLIYYSGGTNSKTYYIMDDFQGSRVFMFGAGFGLALLIVYLKASPPIIRNERAVYTDHFSSVLTLLGTCFVLALFYFVLDTYTIQDKTYALLNIYFAFSGSIVSSIAISCIVNGVVTFHHINMSILSGVLQISIIGGFIKTPYVSLLVGAFAGIVTSLLSSFVHWKMNRNKETDAKGVIVVYLVNCLLCTYFICPIIIKAYMNVDSNLDYNPAFHMIYTSISLGIGFLTGLIASIFRCCIKEENSILDVEFFNKAYMFHPIPPLPKPIVVIEAPTQELLTINNTTFQSRPPAESGLSINL